MGNFNLNKMSGHKEFVDDVVKVAEPVVAAVMDKVEDTMAPAYEIHLTTYLTIIGASLLCVFIGELIGWAMIFRHEDYKTLVKQLIERQKELEMTKQKYAAREYSERLEKKNNEHIKRIEGQVNAQYSAMTGRKGKSTMVVAMLSMFFIWSMGQQFGGVVVA